LILVDTSIWVDHLRAGDPHLRELLQTQQVATHPFIIGEVALCHLRQRNEVMNTLGKLPKMSVADHDEVVVRLRNRICRCVSAGVRPADGRDFVLDSRQKFARHGSAAPLGVWTELIRNGRTTARSGKQTDMGTLVLRNIPDHLHALLKAQARRNRRSISEEVLAMIERALALQGTIVELPPPIMLKGGRLTTDDIESAIAAGRD